MGELDEALDSTEDDNFVATTLMDQYYAMLAKTWFGVPRRPPPRVPYALQ